jgi:hypothetical protein
LKTSYCDFQGVAEGGHLLYLDFGVPRYAHVQYPLPQRAFAVHSLYSHLRAYPDLV